MTRTYTDQEPDWTLIPERMRGGLERWIEKGIVPGHFLCALLSNDLRGAVSHADVVNIRLLRNYVIFLHNYAPRDCWGGDEQFEAWTDKGGLDGLSKVLSADPDVRSEQIDKLARAGTPWPPPPPKGACS